MQILFLFLSCLLFLALKFRTRFPFRDRIISALLAVAWCWCGGVFHRHYFLTINWAATSFAWVFALEGLLLVVFGVVAGQLRFGHGGRITRPLGMLLFLYSAFLSAGFPLWEKAPAQILLFGWGPDQTALGTLGVFLMAEKKGVRLLILIIPLVWCLAAILRVFGMK